MIRVIGGIISAISAVLLPVTANADYAGQFVAEPAGWTMLGGPSGQSALPTDEIERCTVERGTDAIASYRNLICESREGKDDGASRRIGNGSDYPAVWPGGECGSARGISHTSRSHPLRRRRRPGRTCLRFRHTARPYLRALPEPPAPHCLGGSSPSRTQPGSSGGTGDRPVRCDLRHGFEWAHFQAHFVGKGTRGMGFLGQCARPVFTAVGNRCWCKRQHPGGRQLQSPRPKAFTGGQAVGSVADLFATRLARRTVRATIPGHWPSGRRVCERRLLWSRLQVRSERKSAADLGAARPPPRPLFGCGRSNCGTEGLRVCRRDLSHLKVLANWQTSRIHSEVWISRLPVLPNWNSSRWTWKYLRCGCGELPCLQALAFGQDLGPAVSPTIRLSRELRFRMTFIDTGPV